MYTYLRKSFVPQTKFYFIRIPNKTVCLISTNPFSFTFVKAVISCGVRDYIQKLPPGVYLLSESSHDQCRLSTGGAQEPHKVVQHQHIVTIMGLQTFDPAHTHNHMKRGCYNRKIIFINCNM